MILATKRLKNWFYDNGSCDEGPDNSQHYQTPLFVTDTTPNANQLTVVPFGNGTRRAPRGFYPPRLADDNRTGGKVRFALVGLGWFTTEAVVPALRESALCEVGALVSGSLGKAARLREETGARRALSYEEFHAGEGAESYDAVYIATPNATHLEFVETAANLGKPVLCEKPMEVSAARAERSVEVVRGGWRSA